MGLAITTEITRKPPLLQILWLFVHLRLSKYNLQREHPAITSILLFLQTTQRSCVALSTWKCSTWCCHMHAQSLTLTARIHTTTLFPQTHTESQETKGERMLTLLRNRTSGHLYSLHRSRRQQLKHTMHAFSLSLSLTHSHLHTDTLPPLVFI